MTSSLSAQLSSLDLRLLTSVLRTGFSLPQASDSFAQARESLEGWTEGKARAHGCTVDWSKPEEKIALGEFRLEYVKGDAALALLLEHPDPGQLSRVWTVEVALEVKDDIPQFSTRLGFRQPKSAMAPDPRAPRYLTQIVREVGACDQRWLHPEMEVVTEETLPEFVQLLTDKKRRLPIIAVSMDETLQTSHEPEKLDGFLCGVAHVFKLEPGASWALTNHCTALAEAAGSEYQGKMYSVYDAAIRCYQPGFSFADSPYEHKLWLVDAIYRANMRHNGFLNLCVSHAFAAATAQFEIADLLTPAALRRRLQAASRAPVAMPAAEQPASGAEGELAEAPVVELAEPVAEIPQVVLEAVEIELADATEPDAVAEPAAVSLSFDDSAVRLWLEELEIDILRQGEELTRLREQKTLLEAAKASTDADLLQALESNEQLESQVLDLEQRFKAVSRENSDLRMKVGDLEVYQSLCEEMEKRIAVLDGKYHGKGEDSFSRMWKSLSDFVTATQQAASSFELYKKDALVKEQLVHENADLKLTAHNLRAQIDGLRQRQTSDARPRVRLELNDPDSLEEFMNDHELAASVEVLNSARQDFRRHPMQDEERVTGVLTILRDIYLPMKCAPEEERTQWKERFDAALLEAHLENGPTATRAVANTYDDHKVRLGDRSLPCYKIRDKTVDMNHQYFFIVTFAWDDETSTLYIKSFDHGATPSERS